MKYPSIIFVFLLVSFTTVNAQTFSQYYNDIVSNVSQENLVNDLTVFENFGVKEEGTTAISNARNWIKTRYQNLGYTDIEEQLFQAHSGTKNTYNIIITKTGSLYPNTFLIIDGHYDTVNGPGANDNGSGTVLIMELARLMKDIDTEYSIKFIHFSGEESGLEGSEYYVDNTVIPENLDISLVFNIDEVGGAINGFANDKIYCERDEVGNNNNNGGANNAASNVKTQELATCIELYSNLSTVISNAYSSDYMPFEANGEVITGLYEYNESSHPHSSSDLIVNMDLDYLFEVTKGSLGAALHFSVAYQAPCLDSAIWTTAGGWNPMAPTSSTNVTIMDDYDTSVVGASFDACKLTIDNGASVTVASGDYIQVVGDIEVNTGASLTVAHTGSLVQVDDYTKVTNNGSITVEKITTTLADTDFTVIGSPMSEETREGAYGNAALVGHHITGNFVPHPQVAIDFPDADNFADDNGDNWITHIGDLTVGEGYLVRPIPLGDAGGTYTTNYTLGTLNNGVVNFTAIYGDDQIDSPNILANPYASAVDAFEFVKGNAVVDAIFYWEHLTSPNASYPGYNPSNYDMGDISMYNLSGGFAAANAGGDGTQPSNQFIPSGQGFGIKANAARTVTFNNAMRVTGDNDGYRYSATTIDRLYLRIANNTYGLKSGTLIAFTELATDDFDRNYDAKRLATPVSLYSLNSDRELGIQGRSFFNEDHIIPLGFSTQVEENQEYTISISSKEGELISQATVYLKDKLLNTLTNLSETDYSFNSNEGHQNNRFVLVFTEEILGNLDSEMNAISIYPNPTNKTLNIISLLSKIRSVEIVDVQGRKVNYIPMDNQEVYQIDMTSLASAMYFIKINTDSGSVTKRVIKE